MLMCMPVKNFHSKKILRCFWLLSVKNMFQDIISGMNPVQQKLFVMMQNTIIIYKWLKTIKNKINK